MMTTRIVQLVFIFVVAFVTAVQGQGQYNACFDGGCQLVQDSGKLKGTQLMSLSSSSSSSILGTATPALQTVLQRPCLLSSNQCKGSTNLEHYFPCCCEVVVGPGMTADSLIQIEGKFKNNLNGLLEWNGVSQIVEGQTIQLCQTDDSSITSTTADTIVVSTATAQSSARVAFNP